MKLSNKLLLNFGLWITILLIIMLGIQTLILLRNDRDGAYANLQNITDSLARMVSTSYQIYEQKLGSDINVAESFVEGRSRIDKEKRHRVMAVNQITGEEEAILVPEFQIRDFETGEWETVGPDAVDQITSLVGGTVTIFQAFGNGLLRISTNVPTTSGARAIHTYIPSDSPVYKTIMSNREYVGRAYVVNDWYLTAYRPISDDHGGIIGAIYVGISQRELAAVREAIREFKVADSYYSAVFDTEGNFLVHPRWEGRSLDSIQRQDVREAIEMILGLVADGEYHGKVRYQLGGRERLNFYSYVPGIEWVVTSGIDASELWSMALSDVTWSVAIGAVMIVGILLLIRSISRSVTLPLKSLTSAADQLVHLDFDVALPESADEETRQLTSRFRSMAHELKNSYQDLESKIQARTEELERKNHELTIAVEKARQAEKAKSAFLATMSHEIRTPMNAVVGMTSLLSQTRLTAEQREFVETIQQSGEGLLTIINDVLDYSKIEFGRLDLHPAPFDLLDCVEGVVEVLTAKVREKRLELITSIAPDVPPCLLGDAPRLRQVLLNLLGNSIKFTEHGEVSLRIALGKSPDDHRCRIGFAVKDSGIGIPPAARKLLFRPFSQADSSATRRFGGTGLGLVISKRIIEAMGGSISVESSEGVGSSFQFDVHLAEAECVGGVTSPAEWAHFPGRRILVVEDNDSMRSEVLERVRSWGADPLAAASGREAVHILDSGIPPPDLALIDHSLPDVDGMELARQIHARSPTKALPTVLMSLRSAPPDLGAACLSLAKPYRLSSLHRAIQECLHSRPGTVPTRRSGKSLFDPGLAARYPLRILIAEDNLINQKVVLRFLKACGYQADCVADGVEAIESVKEKYYDLILMDVQMPRLDGLTATRRIREFCTENGQPHIIALSAGVLEEERQKVFEAGMDKFLPKPVQAEQFVEILEMVGHRVVSSGRRSAADPSLHS